MHLEPSEKALHLYDWLLPQLRAFYARVGRRLSRHELKLEIEKLWGDEIVHRVCIPQRMSQGQCLSIAAALAMTPAPLKP